MYNAMVARLIKTYRHTWDEVQMNAGERAELVDLVAQAVIDRLEERRQVEMLVDMVMNRMTALQQEEQVSNRAGEIMPQVGPCATEVEE